MRDFSPESLDVLSNSPAIQPPAGVESNFSNPENRNPLLLVVTSLLFGIMGIFFLIRVYTKSFIVRKYSWDDCKSNLFIAMTGNMTDAKHSDCGICCCEC